MGSGDAGREGQRPLLARIPNKQLNRLDDIIRRVVAAVPKHGHFKMP